MPSITNVGGSLTSALFLTLIAWAVRFFRATARKKNGPLVQSVGNNAHLGRHFAVLTPATVRMLVETNPIPHEVIDVRSIEEAQEHPLPEELKAAVRLSLAELPAALGEDAVLWGARTAGRALPAQHHLLLFIAASKESGRQCAAAAAAKGFERTAVLEGGLAAYAEAAAAQRDLHWISRDAVALAVGAVDSIPRADKVKLLDVRRHDERTLYGCIPGSIHVPVDQLAAALHLSPEQWEACYHSQKPDSGDYLIVQSRTNGRAAWAAQIAHDLGYQRCLVHRQGTYGWRVHPGVKAYRRYERGSPPPEPEPFQLEHVNVAAARDELLHLGLPVPA